MLQTLFLPILVLAALTPQMLFAQWGHLKGQVLWEGEIPIRKVLIEKSNAKKDPKCCAAKEAILSEDLVIDPKTRGVANCVVYLSRKPAKTHPDLTQPKQKEVKVEIENCTYKPHVLVVHKDQRVRVVAKENCGHSTKANMIRNQKPCGSFPSINGEQFCSFRAAEFLPMKIECNIHPWMNAYWYVVDHPYAVVTDKDGKFEIKNLPVGTHEFKVWQEKAGYLERKLTITLANEKTQTVTVKADKDDFKFPLSYSSPQPKGDKDAKQAPPPSPTHAVTRDNHNNPRNRAGSMGTPQRTSCLRGQHPQSRCPRQRSCWKR